MEEEPIKISINIFKEINKNSSIDERLKQKIDNIVESVRNKLPIDKREFYPKSPKSPKSPKTRFHVVSVDFSNEGQTKKNLKSLLNKVTEANKDVIIEKLRNELTDSTLFFYSSLSFIQQDKKTVGLYLDVMKSLIKSNEFDNLMHQYFKEYKENKLWIVPQYYNNIDVYSKDCDYDDYCKFIKWKVSAICLIELWRIYNDITICKELSSILTTDIEMKISGKRQEIDSLLEQIEILREYLDMDRFKVLKNIKDKDKSTYFKILDILDKK